MAQKKTKVAAHLQLTVIQKKIFEVRGQRVMFDFHLAEMFETNTKSINLAVKRNLDRFPGDFMFLLTKKEWESLRLQIETSKRGGRRYIPHVFTEHGVTMLANLLKSQIAIKMSLMVVRAFILLRQMVYQYKDLDDKIRRLEKKYNKQFKNIYEALKVLLYEKELQKDWNNRERIGFKK